MGKPMLVSVYEVVLTIVFVLAAPIWMYRRWHHFEEMRERFGILPARATGCVDAIDASGKPLWFHAASLGELEAAASLIEGGLVPRGRPIHLTVTSTSARARATDRLAGRASVSYAPLDLPWMVRRFLDRVQPRALVILETELWPGMTWGCQERELPVFIASGRLADRNWRRSRALSWFRGLWDRFEGVAVQTETDRERFLQLGASRVRVCGNVKYRARASRPERVPRANREPALLWTIGSLRRGEERVLEVARELAGEGVQVVLAPRHLREMEHWRAVLMQQGWTVQLRSEATSLRLESDSVREWLAATSAGSPDNPHILLVDLHGELTQWYEVADIASVGGSWVPLGGHNLFEAVREGCAVSFGPYTEGVKDLAEVLVEEQIGFVAERPEDLIAWIRAERGRDREKRERAAHHATRRLAGAVERTRYYFQELRPDLFSGPEEIPEEQIY